MSKELLKTIVVDQLANRILKLCESHGFEITQCQLLALRIVMSDRSPSSDELLWHHLQSYIAIDPCYCSQHVCELERDRLNHAAEQPIATRQQRELRDAFADRARMQDAVATLLPINGHAVSLKGYEPLQLRGDESRRCANGTESKAQPVDPFDAEIAPNRND